ncbi:MFS transporter [Celeribacter indicus]|uniref:Putative permease of the major facilitator superfamily MFS1 n=1 Tax=Celeribacter indicus TaxID=1208324 RepID=A0A0B5DN24_9RHOB|nr:MFS transporter [Celeribacter indicus]AJE45018.1 Putative permease of the major facilitator superfamily MFS1 [Celeribacter indicus]SDW94557.1 MFS transporter, DHA1 family, inner membrane transport protein [Celeribacter indicus]
MTDLATAPAHIRPGIIQFALAMGGFAIGTTEFASMSLLPYLARGLGIGEAEASHVISAYALGVVVGAPVIAVLAARFERRRLLVALMGLFCVANLMSAFAPDYGTMLLFRFLSGVPHGAYFGIAALMAASLVAPNQRGKAVARLMLGLTIATVLGVPMSNVLGQSVGWRWAFALVAVLAAVTGVLILTYAPRGPKGGASSDPLRELSALGNRQVLLTLLSGAVGFGGFFAIYTYLASILLEVTHLREDVVPLYLAVMGIGMTFGTLIAGWAADRALNLSVFLLFAINIGLMLSLPALAGQAWGMLGFVVAMGLAGGFPILGQTRLMLVAGEAQSLAASLHHSAFNVANALGPFVASLFIARGYGFPSAGYVGAALTLGGAIIYAITLMDYRRIPARSARRPER